VGPFAGRKLPKRRLGVRSRAAAGRCLPVDRVGVPALRGLLYVSLPRVQRGVFRTRVSRVERQLLGDSFDRRPQLLSKLGPAAAQADLRRRSARVGSGLMCRLAAYVGPAAPLSTLLYDPLRSLEFQSYRPREQLSGFVNVDGTGVAWWDSLETEPMRYVTERPPWSDPNLPLLARRLRAIVQLAAVRSATPGMPFGPASVAPFVHEGIACAHNGYLREFKQRTRRTLLARLPDHLFAALDAGS